jgi:hypothetical protein
MRAIIASSLKRKGALFKFNISATSAKSDKFYKNAATPSPFS